MTILYMLDTNIVSAALKRNALIDARLSELDPSAWCISAVTRAEIRFGVERRPLATNLARRVAAFLAIAQTQAWNAAAADEHGRVRARLEGLGTHIGDFDEMIAAHAIALGAVLVTDNTRHFERVEGLPLENWLRQP